MRYRAEKQQKYRKREKEYCHKTVSLCGMKKQRKIKGILWSDEQKDAILFTWQRGAFHKTGAGLHRICGEHLSGLFFDRQTAGFRRKNEDAAGQRRGWKKITIFLKKTVEKCS